ncbi:MAG: 50S ribosomal protein L13, partial [Acidimicrobiia bacterium]|nr:50S ribosomal protein L13 [Acidimicrobiia bacterium]
MATYMPKKQDVPRQWHCIDAEGKTLGRLAVEIAGLLRGKGKPQYSPHVDCGDFVVVVNAAKLAVSGDKGQQVLHHRHSGYPGGLKSSLLADELARHPDRVLVRAVRGMMPKNRLSRKMLRKLKVYAGPEHPHHAQFAGEPGEPGQGKNRKKKKVAAAPEPEPAKKPRRRKPKAEPKAEEPADEVETDEVETD